MKKALTILIVAAVIIGGYFLLRGKQNPASKESVKLGVIAGTTGAYASAGEGYLKGFNLAVEEWNNSNELKFSTIVEDDGFDAVKGLSAYRKINASDNVEAYAILSSFTIDATYDLLHTEGKPVALGFEQSKPAENDNIFQVLPAARPVQLALGQELKRLGYTKPAAVVSNNTPVYQNFYSGFIEGYGEGAAKYDLSSDISGIRAQALSITGPKPDIVVFFAVPKDAALLVKEILKISGSNPPDFAFDQSIQSGITDYQNILGSDMQRLNGSIVSMSKNDLSEGFKNSFRKKYSEEPPFGADMGYNSFMLLANTYSQTSSKWINNLRDVKLIGADGEIMFDGSGLRVPNVYFGKLQDSEVK